MARGGGGGGRGGGFSGGSRGGGFSGGRHGGSFGGMNRGSMHRTVVHHHVGHGTGGFSGGGCGGCGCGFFVLPILFFLLIAALFGNQNSGSTMHPEPDYNYNSGSIVYDEGRLEDYASARYDDAFSRYDAYEDDLLLCFVVWEDRSDFSYLTWVGDHISNEAYAMLGGNDTELGLILERYVQYGYSDTLTDDLCRALNALAAELEDLDIYTCGEDHSGTPSSFKNRSDLWIDEYLIEEAIDDFTERTGIPFALVIAEAEDVFG